MKLFKSNLKKILIVCAAIVAPLIVILSDDAIAQISTNVNIRWNANPEEERVTSYELSIGSSSGIYESVYTSTTPTRSVSLPDGLYYASVRAQNVKGFSLPSEEISFKVGQAQFSLVVQSAPAGSQVWTTSETILSNPYDPSLKRFWRMKLTDTQAIVETSIDLMNWAEIQAIASNGANTKQWRINLNKL